MFDERQRKATSREREGGGGVIGAEPDISALSVAEGVQVMGQERGVWAKQEADNDANEHPDEDLGIELHGSPYSGSVVKSSHASRAAPLLRNSPAEQKLSG